jgi:hypothetical protein
MSEYTRYCAVPNSFSEEEVRKLLGDNEIVSIVDNASYIKNPKVAFSWIVVAIYDEAKNLPKLQKLFPQNLMLYVQENQKDWSLFLTENEKTTVFKIHNGQDILDSDIEYVAKFFNLPADDLRSDIRPSGPYPFTVKVGLPYLELLDQGITFRDVEYFKARGYSILAKNLD